MSDFDLPSCPRCGGDELSWGYSAPPLVWSIQCHADGCEVALTAETEAESLQLWRDGKWTHRVIEYTDDGHPVWATREQSN